MPTASKPGRPAKGIGPITIDEPAHLAPPGTYRLRLLNLREVKNGRGHSWWWEYEIIGGDYLPVLGFTPPNPGHPKTFAWISVMLGREPTRGERITDPTVMIGNECSGIVAPSKREPEYERVVTAIYPLDHATVAAPPQPDQGPPAPIQDGGRQPEGVADEDF